mgnify:CR=1 FL=1|jgi:hypothetical protein
MLAPIQVSSCGLTTRRTIPPTTKPAVVAHFHACLRSLVGDSGRSKPATVACETPEQPRMRPCVARRVEVEYERSNPPTNDGSGVKPIVVYK